MITFRLNKKNSNLSYGQKLALALKSFSKCGLSGVVRYMTAIARHYLVLDTKVVLKQDAIRGLAEAMEAEISPPPRIKEGMIVASTVDPLQYHFHSIIDDEIGFLYLIEKVVRIPDGRLFLKGAPFRGSFTNEAIQRGEWLSSTYEEDLELYGVAFWLSFGVTKNFPRYMEYFEDKKGETYEAESIE